MDAVSEVMLVIQNRTRNVCFRLGAWLICVGLLAALPSPAHADWIPGFPPEPNINESPTNLDMTHWFLTVNYDGAGNFSVSSQYPGVAVLNNFSDPIYDIGSNSTLNISMSINPSTGAPVGGNITITGDASTYYAASPSGTLLTGTISKFGFPGPIDAANAAGAENFQFLFTTTGGDLAPWYPTIAMNLEFVGVNFSGVFGNTAFFDDSGVAQSDTFSGPPVSPVPEPSSLSLLCFGALAMTAGVGVLRGTRVLRGSPMR